MYKLLLIMIKIYYTLIISSIANEWLASKCVSACITLTLLPVGVVIRSTGGPWILLLDTSRQLREGHHFKAVELLSLGECQLLQGNAISLGAPLSVTAELDIGACVDSPVVWRCSHL
jgi:hypothetical protein